MDAVVQSFVSGIPVLLGHFALTLALLAAGIALYVVLTSIHEIRLIRDDNRAAAVSLGGSIVAMAIPLASAMASSVNLYDILVFGAVAIVLQLACELAVGLILRDLPERIAKGEIASAMLLVSIKLAVAAINAAALSV